MGIAGPKELVRKIQKRIVTFVKSDLKLNISEGKITHIGAGKVNFLGMIISAVSYSKFSRNFGKRIEKVKRVKNRIKLQKEIRKKRELKVVRKVLRKALKGDSKTISKIEIDKSVLALKSQINLNYDFSKQFADIYRQFFEAIMSNMISVDQLHCYPSNF